MQQADRGRGARRDRHGRPAVHRAARGPPVVPARPGSARASGPRASATRDAAPGGSPAPIPDEIAERSGRAGDARARAQARVLGARRVGRRRDRAGVRRRRPHRRQQRAQLPDGPDVPLLIPEVNADHLGAARRAGRRARLARAHRHQPELLDRRARDGARAAARRSACASCLVTTLQAISGAGYPGVAVVGHPRQRDPVHRRRGGEDRDRDRSKILGTLRGRARSSRTPMTISAHTTRVPVHDGHTESISVALDAAAVARRELRRGVRRRSGRAAGAGPAVGARRGRSSTWTSRTARSRASTSDRGRGMTVTRRAPAAAARCSTASSSRSATTRSAAPRAPRS